MTTWHLAPPSDPVVTADGHTYERAAIEDWFSTCSGAPTAPLTGTQRHSSQAWWSSEFPHAPCAGEALPSATLIPNRSLKAAIAEWVLTRGGKWLPRSPPSAPAFVQQRSAGSGVGSTRPIVEGVAPVAHAITALPPPPPSHVASGSGTQAASSALLDSAAESEDVKLVERQRVGSHGLTIICSAEQVGDSVVGVRWAVRNQHSSRRALQVRLVWKPESSYVPYNYNFPPNPIVLEVSYGATVQAYRSDKIAPFMPLAGSGAEWQYNWRAV